MLDNLGVPGLDDRPKYAARPIYRLSGARGGAGHEKKGPMLAVATGCCIARAVAATPEHSADTLDRSARQEVHVHVGVCTRPTT